MSSEQTNDGLPDEMLKRCLAAMGDSIRVADACYVAGHMAAIFLSRLSDSAFESWVESVRRTRQYHKERRTIARRKPSKINGNGGS